MDGSRAKRQPEQRAYGDFHRLRAALASLPVGAPGLPPLLTAVLVAALHCEQVRTDRGAADGPPGAYRALLEAEDLPLVA